MKLPLSVLCALVCGGCGEAPFPDAEELARIESLVRVLTPPPSPTNRHADELQAAALGQQFFEDPGFSSCRTLSCASCHKAPTFANDSPRVDGCAAVLPTERNTPALVNVAFRKWLNWNGNKDSVWSHAILPLSRPTEMNAPPELVKARVSERYAAEYRMVFGTEAAQDPPELTVVNFGKAVEAYLRRQVQVDSPFDDKVRDFVRSARDGDAESNPYYLPLKTFVRTGQCQICHRGHQLTDESFHNLGVDESVQLDDGRLAGLRLVRADRLNGVGSYSDSVSQGKAKLDTIDLEDASTAEGAFKTPTLRNVALTAPYFHTGAVKTLEEVIDFYNAGGDENAHFAGRRSETINRLDLSVGQKRALLELLTDLTAKTLSQ